VARLIVHIDMDAFFAAHEQRDCPAYAGQPIVVGGTPHGRGVVAAASYEARRFGIRSAMPAREALRLCPQVIFVKPRFELYRRTSQQIGEIFRRYTAQVEPLSLDEAYLDLSDHPQATREEELTQEIRQAIFTQTALTCSAGIAENKFLAKLASEKNKPNGQFLLRGQAVQPFLDALPVGQFHGIGPAGEKRLQAAGIHCGLDVRTRGEQELVVLLGKWGRTVWHMALGVDERPVESESVRKSISVEETYPRDLRSILEVRRELFQLCRDLHRRLAKHEAKGKTVQLKIRYGNFETHSHQLTLSQLVSSEGDLWAAARILLEQSSYACRPVRLLGLGLSNLGQEEEAQDSLPLC
jgi:DNA polymerase-4